MPLDGQIAIVTGGGQGIGQQIALRLAQDRAHVVIADINKAGGQETVQLIADKFGREAVFIHFDITAEPQVSEMVQAAMAIDKHIDILVNNAGIAGPVEYIEDVTLKAWENTLAVNLGGVFLCCKHVIPIMKKQNKGNIVNLASITGKNPLPQRIPYATTKMGVIGLTRTLAAEVGKWNIRVNAVCPGSVTGDRQKIVFEGIMKYTGKTWDEVVAERTASAPLRTLIDPKYVASVVSFLCSEDSAMMTGQDINISAGRIMF